MIKVARFISVLSDMTNKLISKFVVLLIFLLSLLLGVAVFYRYALNDSIYWSNEVARYLLAYIVFLGSTMAHKHKTHIRIDMIFTYISDKMRKNLEIIIGLLFITFWVTIMTGCIKLFPLFMMQTTATLQIPYAIPFASLPISAVIWILYCVDDILNEVVKNR
jgi:TRAP-type C4-dicarboxylate transport system permease small subunit